MGVLYSGGKDSTYAVHAASRNDEVACLVTLSSQNEASYMFHFPNVKWTRLQAQAMGLPQVFGETAGIKEEELVDLETTVRRARDEFGIKGLYTGAMASVYQKARVERVCERLELDCVSPLWGVDAETHLRNLVAEGYSVEVVGVSALGLGEEWLGRILDSGAVGELVRLAGKYRFHAGLEGGEGETFVLDAPLFSKRIEVVSATKHWQADSGYLEITDARLVEKASRPVRAA